MKRQAMMRAVALATAMASIVPQAAFAAKPSLSAKSATMTVGAKKKLTVKNGGSAKIKWSSSNKKVATVDANGVVTAKKAGKAKIKAKVGKKTLTAKVTVKAPKTTISATKAKLTAGQKFQLTATGAGRFKWSSSNKKVATVSKNGLITAKKAGTAKITVSSGGSKKTCKVTVVKAKSARLSVTGIPGAAVDVGSKFSPKLKTDPAIETQASWKSSNPGVASVDAKGVVTAKGAGKATITASIPGTKLALSFDVSVNNAPRASSGGTASGGRTSGGASTSGAASGSQAGAAKVSSISAKCSLASASSMSEITAEKLTVTAKMGDGTTRTIKSFSVKVAESSDRNSFVATVTAEGKTATVTIPKKASAAKAASIKATCSLASATSMSEITSDKVKVTASLTDGTTRDVKSFSVKVATTSDGSKFAVTVTAEGLTTTTYVPKRQSTTVTKTLKDFEVKAPASVKYGTKLTNSDVTVTGKYSDGTSGAIAFDAEISFDRDAARYVVKVTTEIGTKTAYVAATDAPQAETAVPGKTLKGASYGLKPSTVRVGENLAAGQVAIVAEYSDGSTENVTDYSTDFTPKQVAGKYKFNVTWKGGTKELEIEVKEDPSAEPTLKPLSVKPKRDYVWMGETADASVVAVTATMSDGSTRDVTGECSMSWTPGANDGDLGNLSISYQGQTLNQSLYTYDRNAVKSLSVEHVTSVREGENFKDGEIKVTAATRDGRTYGTNDFTHDFTPKAPGTYKVTVSHGGLTSSFDVTVTALK